MLCIGTLLSFLHIDEISKNFSFEINALKRIATYINQDTATKVYQGPMEPYFTYCASVWDDFGSRLSDKLQKLLNSQSCIGFNLPVL